MYISEFAKTRNKSISAITNYIAKHEEQFKGHIRKNGNKSILDDVAIGLLEKKYPMPKPIEILKDTESMEKLLKAQEVIIQLQAQINQEQKLLAQAESMKMLLEDREMQLDQLKKKIEELEQTNKNLSDNLIKVKNRGLIARVFNK